MLGAYTMEKLCAECSGDFRSFTSDILKTHLKIQAPVWLASLIQVPPAENDPADVA
jgi:hypothetical protein